MDSIKCKDDSEIPGLIKKYKLDRRFKYQSYSGMLVTTQWVTLPCTGCECDCSDGHGCNHGNSGCYECGYQGKVRTPVPNIVFKSINQS